MKNRILFPAGYKTTNPGIFWVEVQRIIGQLRDYVYCELYAAKQGVINNLLKYDTDVESVFAVLSS